MANSNNKYFQSLLKIGLSIILCFLSCPLSNIYAAESTINLSGYIKPDLLSNPTSRADFKVDALGTGVTGLTNNNGYFELLNMPLLNPAITIKITKPGYLCQEIELSTAAEGSFEFSVPILMLEGDITQDYAINMSDIIEISKSFGYTAESLLFNSLADVNKDEVINMTDAIYIAKHFNKTTSDYPPVSISHVTAVSNLDKFGIKELYETHNNGRQWFSKFDQGETRTKTWGADVLDSEIIFRGSGSYTIYGSSGEKAGQMKVTGSTPRIYVRGSSSEAVPPPAGTAMWNNVEVTFYCMTSNSGSNISYAGIEAVVKTNHCPDSDDCTTRGYGGRVLFDGRVDIEKECSHKNGGNKRTSAVYPWEEKGRMPLNKWIGYKLVARNIENSTKCKIEVYIDRTEGLNGGNWELVTSFIDYDGWSSDTPSCCDIHKGKVLLEPNYSVYLRTDGLGEQFYKWFSVREIS